nr:uncharacterized protein LOC113823993 isoform X1 [Penaeus vannamei]
MEPSRSEVRARSGCDQFTSSPLVYLAISAVDVHCAVVSAGRFIIISGIYNFQAERSAAGKRDVRPSVCASLPRAVAGRARAGESVGELAPLRVTLESPWRILHRGILIPVTGHRPQCLLALARSKQVPSCDSECIIVSSDFILIAFEILVTYIILEKAKY